MPPETLGHYKILTPLGAGSMGEVYAAEDTKLHRRVALKLLPPALANDAERRKRFEREARAVAALNHPAIVTIYSVEEEQGVPFLTMELVDGKPLREIIPKGGAPVDVVLRVGLAASEAVAYAHQHGIIHRDLKPANVMVTPEGRVKILDFGLAKLRGAAAVATDSSTLMMGQDLTDVGRIVGTVAYMSPEQAMGRAVDHRSDIFSLGVLLHEMATGERPFKGDTDISVISAIIKDTPTSISDLRPDLPAALTRSVRRCLAKDPLKRYQSAQDLHTDLEELKQDLTNSVAVTAPVPVRRRRTSVHAAVAAIVLIAAAAGGWFLLSGLRSKPYVFVPDRFVQLTDSGEAFLARLSPDGRYVVHAKAGGGGVSLWVRQTAAPSDVKIVPESDARIAGASFSNDGTYVYYVTYPRQSGVATMYKVPALGGAPVRVLDDIDSVPSFSPDGTQFSFMRGETGKGIVSLMVANADGSGVRRLVEPTAPLRFSAVLAPWSPDGKRILLPATVMREVMREGAWPARLHTVDVATAALTPFGGDWESISSVEWMPDGHSIVVTGAGVDQQRQQIWQVMYPGGERHRITTGLNAYHDVSVADGGRLLATIQTESRSHLWIYPLGGGAPRQVTTARGVGGGGLAWTPDGRLVYTKWTAETSNQLWIMDADGGRASQLTGGKGFAAHPVVSADGNWVYYNGDPATTDRSAVYRLPLAGGDPQLVSPGPGDFLAKVSPDGKWVYYIAGSSGRNQTMKVAAEGGTPVALTPPELGFTLGALSPDGSRLLGTAWNAERHRSQPAFVSTADGTLEFQDDVPPGATWMPDGRQWVYSDARVKPPGVYVKPTAGGAPRLVADVGQDRSWRVAVSTDARQLAVLRGNATVDVVLVRAK